MGAELPPMSHRTKFVFHAVALFRLGRWADFWATFDQLDAVVEHDRPLSYHTMRLYGVAAYLKELAGDPEAADAMIAELDATQATRGSIGVSGARLWVVQTLIRRGRLADARRRLDEHDPARGSQNRDLTLEAWADLIIAEQSWGEAPDIVERTRAWAEQAGLAALPVFADRLDACAMLARGDLELGLDRLREARDGFARLGITWEVARTELMRAEALVPAARSSEAAEAASAALASLASLDAPVEIERARQLLATAG
jgi:hypothetical protein